ncbi:Breast carcinoma-amplified sequence 3 [Portunus trituberculatus]|uniref:Breast carcinoma-amplified sequence 3 n=1 Tax=Portunus trituberculatus TaxID=210409 RepID=A0A5B7F6M0_PORTR|nr:Breast carcinoma-amplified sequence 3 [Portunus trituberculatus]
MHLPRNSQDEWLQHKTLHLILSEPKHVTPQTYNNPSHYEGKETILWVRFDYCDINDLARFRDKIEVNGNSPPLILIVGYACGVQRENCHGQKKIY